MATDRGASAVPWERRAELGTVAAFAQTVKAVLLRPGDILGAPGHPITLGAPFVFALICQTIGALFSALWQIGMMVVTTGQVGIGELGVLGVLGAFAGPLLALNTMFLWGGIVHVALLMLSAGRGGFSATARVQAYASASTLWNVVPVVGGFIALVWGVVVQVLGLASAHETSAGRTLGAVLAPILLCCLFGLALFGLMLFSMRSMSW